MLRLFVDDIRPAPEGWHLARTVTEAIRVLATAPVRVTEVSVDHDIAHEVKEGGEIKRYACHETFEPIVRFIAIMPKEDRPDKVTIHTANIAKSDTMAALLEGTGIKVEIDTANRWGTRKTAEKKAYVEMLREVGDLVIDARGACWHGTPSQALTRLSDAEVLLNALIAEPPAIEGVGNDEVLADLRKVLEAVRDASALSKEAKLDKAAQLLQKVHNIPLEMVRKA